MLEGIDHVAIAVSSIDDALLTWRDVMGFELAAIETVEDQKVRVAVLTNGPHRVELVEPSADESPIAKYLAKRGGGLHHLCLRVADIDQALERFKAKGLQLIDEAPKPGADGRRIAFVHPKATGGVLLELSQIVDEDAANAH